MVQPQPPNLVSIRFHNQEILLNFSDRECHFFFLYKLISHFLYFSLLLIFFLPNIEESKCKCENRMGGKLIKHTFVYKMLNAKWQTKVEKWNLVQKPKGASACQIDSMKTYYTPRAAPWGLGGGASLCTISGSLYNLLAALLQLKTTTTWIYQLTLVAHLYFILRNKLNKKEKKNKM